VIRLVVTDRKGTVREVEAEDGLALMFVLRDHAGLPVEGLCGGCAACGTCHVFVDDDWVDRLPPRQPAEADMLDQLYHVDDRRSRLSCQVTATPALDGLCLTLAPEE
jgi:ferredoxin, 2Fe-2S